MTTENSKLDIVTITVVSNNDEYTITNDAVDDTAYVCFHGDLKFFIEDQAQWIQDCVEPRPGTEFAFSVVLDGVKTTDFDSLLQEAGLETI